MVNLDEKLDKPNIGQRAKQLLNDTLNDYVNVPLAKAGHPNIGAGLAAAGSAIGDVAIPESATDLAMAALPIAPIGKFAKYAPKLAEAGEAALGLGKEAGLEASAARVARATRIAKEAEAAKATNAANMAEIAAAKQKADAAMAVRQARAVAEAEKAKSLREAVNKGTIDYTKIGKVKPSEGLNFAELKSSEPVKLRQAIKPREEAITGAEKTAAEISREGKTGKELSYANMKTKEELAREAKGTKSLDYSKMEAAGEADRPLKRMQSSTLSYDNSFFKK